MTLLPKQELEVFCKKNHILRLSLFGSAIRGTEQPDSDIDVLVEFEPDHVPGFAFFKIEQELSRLIGRRVDLNTPGFLNKHFRDRVMKESQVQYAISG